MPISTTLDIQIIRRSGRRGPFAPPGVTDPTPQQPSRLLSLCLTHSLADSSSMAAVLHPKAASSSCPRQSVFVHTSTCQTRLRHVRRLSRPAALVVHARRSGPLGLNVNGHRPTSPQGWAEMAHALREAQVKSISAQELKFAQEKGVPIVDIRPEEDYLKGHIPGALNVPFYQPIQGWTPWQTARRVGYALFGVLNGTEINPNFMADLEPLVSTENGAILYCGLGGSLEPSGPKKNGLQTRSLIAAYELVSNGFTNVNVLKGGFVEWEKNGREIEVFEAADEAAA